MLWELAHMGEIAFRAIHEHAQNAFNERINEEVPEVWVQWKEMFPDDPTILRTMMLPLVPFMCQFWWHRVPSVAAILRVQRQGLTDKFDNAMHTDYGDTPDAGLCMRIIVPIFGHPTSVRSGRGVETARHGWFFPCITEPHREFGMEPTVHARPSTEGTPRALLVLEHIQMNVTFMRAAREMQAKEINVHTGWWEPKAVAA